MNQPQGSGWGDTCTFVVLIMTAGFPSTKSSGDLEEHDLLLTGPGGYTVTETTQKGLDRDEGKSVDLGLCLYFRAQACGGISRVYFLLENLKLQEGNLSKVFCYLGCSALQKGKLHWVRDARGGQPGSLPSCLLIVVPHGWQFVSKTSVFTMVASAIAKLNVRQLHYNRKA